MVNNYICIEASNTVSVLYAAWSVDLGGVTSYIAKDEDEEVCIYNSVMI